MYTAIRVGYNGCSRFLRGVSDSTSTLGYYHLLSTFSSSPPEPDLFACIQVRRSTCSDCTDCKGFGIWFRACDANNPEVMLHCSLCGCPADRHPVDLTWKRMEEAKAAREAEAAAQRARRAQQAATQHTTLAQVPPPCAKSC